MASHDYDDNERPGRWGSEPQGRGSEQQRQGG